MNSELPKVCHKYKGSSMILHAIQCCNNIPVTAIWVVMGKYRDVIYDHIGNNKITEIRQLDALGTGHAVQCALPNLNHVDENDCLLILPGDAPLIKTSTLRKMYAQHLTNNSDCTLLTCHVPNPYGYGRIILDEIHNGIKSIVEEKDASNEQRKIDLVNGGFYIFRINNLIKYLPQLDNNNVNGEYYLTDLIEIYRKNGLRVDAYVIDDHNEISNVNTQEELERINAL